MAKVIVVTSGKGGVGKTTSTAALGAALACRGGNVVVVDFDVGLRNLDLVMGAERRVVYDLINVVQGVVKLPQALIRDKRVETLFLLPASQTRDKDALTEDGVGRVINELRAEFDWVICDSPAGIERGATLAMRFADAAVIVANSEVSSVRDSDRIIGLLELQDGEGGEGGADGEAPLDHPLRRGACRSRRDALDRRRAGDSERSPARHRSGKPGGPARLQSRYAGDALRNRQRTRSRLYRCGPSALRRGHKADHSHRKEELLQQAVLTEGGMKLFNFFRPAGSAPVARERLQILLEYERKLGSHVDLIAVLREEIFAVLSRHVTVDPNNVQISVDRGIHVSTLAVDIEIPNARRGTRSLS